MVDFASVTNRFDHDAFGQRTSATDGRGNTTDFVYSREGLLLSRIDAATNATHFVYDAAGRNISTIDALGHAAHVAYDAANRKIAEWGAVYPAVYAYDSYGRTIALATTRDTNFVLSAEAVPDLSNPPGALDVTRWDYDEATGLLLNKRYADGKGPSYAYSPEGLLARRTWARGVTTDYAYDDFDSLVSKTYSDETPSVSLGYDAQGRLLAAICEGVSTNVYAYDRYGQVTNELQNGTALARFYDAFGRPMGYRIGDGLAEGSAVSYAYDASGRFSAVSSGTNTFSYSYLPGSSLVSGMSANTGHSWERIYEPNRDLIATVHNRYGDRTISRFDYTNDEIGRRVSRVDSGEAFAETAFDRYSYNERSELTGARRFFGADLADESRPVPDRAFEYAYDPIGNRISSTEEKNGTPVVTSYWSNELNQYTRTTNENATIEFEYDEDGNTTFDGRFHYSWNGENRMLRAEEAVTRTNQSPIIVGYAYDAQGRMIAKDVTSTNSIARTLLWDGLNIICEIENDAPPYNIWGLDLDGRLQGCGGVGGLLAVAKESELFLACYDANGNIWEYFSGNGCVADYYEYAPFGERTSTQPIRFSHGFSTKSQDLQTGLINYQFRSTNPILGRWASRDSLSEIGGFNLYTHTLNMPVSSFDKYGFIVEVYPPLTMRDKDGSATMTRAGHIVTLLKEIVGDCLDFNLKAERIRIAMFSTVFVKVVISYAEKKDDKCRCTDCVGTLKEIMNSPRIFRIFPIVADNETTNHTDPTVNDGADIFIRLGTSVPVPVVAHDDDKKPLPPENTPPSVVLWHELVGHGWKKLIHDPLHDDPDPTIAEVENLARDCYNSLNPPFKLKHRWPHYYPDTSTEQDTSESNGKESNQ